MWYIKRQWFLSIPYNFYLKCFFVKLHIFEITYLPVKIKSNHYIYIVECENITLILYILLSILILILYYY